MARQRGGAPPANASRPAPDDGGGLDEDDERNAREGIGADVPDADDDGVTDPSYEPPDRDSDDDDDDSPDYPNPIAGDDPATGQDSGQDLGGEVSDADRRRVSERRQAAERAEALDPTDPDSPGGATVGSRETERYLAAVQRAGGTVAGLDERGALAAQVERATGVDARSLGGAGSSSRVGVDLDLGEGVFRTGTETDVPATRRRRQVAADQRPSGGPSVSQARNAVEGLGIGSGFGTGRRTQPPQSQAVEGGDVALFASAAPEREEAFGDIVVENPVTGRRVEDELDEAGQGFDALLRDEVESSVEQPTFAQGPVLNTGARLVGLERAGLTAAELLGRDAENLPFTEAENGRIEGPIERGTEAAFRGAGGVGNLPELLAEGKEIGEFAVTQPSRIAQTAETAAGGFVRGAGESGTPLATGALGAADATADDPFTRDVEQRAGNIATTAAGRFEADPVETTAAAAGGVAGGVAGGTAAARAVSRASGGRLSGSDLSGRALQGTSRRIDEFLSDTRGQADAGRLVSDGAGGVARQRSRGDADADTGGVDLDSIQDELDRMAEAERGSFVGRERGEVPGSLDRGDVETARQGSRLSSRARSRMERSSEVPDTPADDLRRLDQLERDLARGRVAAEDVTIPTGLRVNEVTGSAAGLAAAGDVGSAGAASDADAVAGALARRADAESGVLSDTDTDTLLDDVLGNDTRIDVGSRGDVDTRTDTRTDTQTDILTRLDTRFDVRTDTRIDTRQDTRLDTRLDTPGRLDPDVRLDTPRRRDTDLEDDSDRDDDPLGALFATSDEVFDTGVVQSLGELEGTAADPFADADAAVDDALRGL